MSAPVRVLVVDDDALVRKGLVLLLDGAEDIEVVGEAADGDEVPAAIASCSPDVVLMDIRMPRVDGVAATRRLRSRPGAPEVVVLTTFDTDANVLAAIEAGANGFLAKDTPPEDVVEAIQRVSRGDPILSPGATRRLLERAVVAESERHQARRKLGELSEREREVAQAIAEGRSNAQISQELHMSVATAKAHVSHIFTKLGLTNRTQIAVLAHEARLDRPEPDAR
jgi:DNA-binding NarL/FixJ family response regulator